MRLQESRKNLPKALEGFQGSTILNGSWEQNKNSKTSSFLPELQYNTLARHERYTYSMNKVQGLVRIESLFKGADFPSHGMLKSVSRKE